MKVYMAQYASAVWTAGGKERIIRDLHSALHGRGVDVELLDPWQGCAEISREPNQILHLFGSEYFQYELASRARSRGMKTVVTSILVFPDRKSERLVRLGRVWDHVSPITTTFGLRRRLLTEADAVLYGTEHERKLAVRVYGVRPERLRAMPLPVSMAFVGASPDAFVRETGLRDFVLSVGRIEPRKNVLAVIEATRRVGVPLVVIGRVDPAYPKYVKAFEAARARCDHVHYFPPMSIEDPRIASAFAAARAHVLASFHEQVGMVNVEAALAGTQVITSDVPGVREYLGDYPMYIDPTDVDDIARAIRAAYLSTPHPAITQRIVGRYTADAVARRLVGVYQSLFDARDSRREAMS